jgi:rhomboid protease GluP
MLFDADLLIKVIISVNAAMYILSLLLKPTSTGLSLNPFTFLSPDGTSLFLLGATGWAPVEQYGRWWTLLSANYLHGSILHILFNMIALRQIGPLIVQEYGGHRMIILYTLSGVVGFWVSVLFGVRFTIGASAAVCGLIGAALYYGKSRGGAYGQTIYSQVGGWAVSIFIFGLLVPGINNWGHGGGLLGGIALALLLGYNERSPESVFHKIFAGICMIATALVLGWAIITGLLLGMMR